MKRILTKNKLTILTLALFSILTLFYVTSLFAAEEERKSLAQEDKPSIKYALIKDGTIEEATHYHLIEGGWTNPNTPSAKWNNPRAFFYAYRRPARGNEFADNKFLGQIEVGALDAQTIEKLDKLIDPQAQLPQIHRAIIKRCVKRGRYVNFYDVNEELVDTSNRYTGPLDIKTNQRNTRLIKPHFLLDGLERVKESKPPFWGLALLGVGDSQKELVYDR